MTDTATRAISVIVADDDPGVRQALAELLADDPRFALVGTTESGADAAGLARSARPQLAIVDVHMPQGGVEAIEAIREASAETKVVVYSAKRGRRVRSEMLAAGAVGFLAKGDAVDLNGALVDFVSQPPARPVPN